MSSLVGMRMSWDSKSFAALTATEAVWDHNTCPMLYLPALPKAEDSQPGACSLEGVIVTERPLVWF